ncbi:hypothetical protein [Actinomadura montaniterrae]|uniref:Uncharacterized protein n=1 Tax=Actinomadura montaniterrae TaxID=1803903 RepID=A0A6L3VR23_9ACTN|nr:hypothetical protein [Actinomadura montaniterrae]KAB2379243.1 hypothetical protein F9B16_21245 [Actinomadura montaniterrae]
MLALRRVGLFVVLPLVLIAVAAFSWYRLSDTSRGYQDKLAGYCQGLIPEAESADFTDHEEKALRHDEHHVDDDGLRWESCDVGDLRLTIGDVGETLVNSGIRNGFFTLLLEGLDDNDETPMAIGGGWEGYTDLRNTGVVMGCTNRHASVVVSAVSDGSLMDARARQVARLVTATAARAAHRGGCDAKSGGPIPPLSQPAKEMSPETIGGTCAGIPVKTVVETGEVNWIKESAGSGNAPVEGCTLGRTVAFSSAAYHFQANYGPYAQALRTAPSGSGESTLFRTGADFGRSRDHAWATARCSGHGARALFSVSATEYADPTARFLTTSLRAFAEHAVQRHGCTGLRLPR